MDTQLQNFWVESIHKEAALRFAWHLRYSNKFAKSAFATGGKPAQPKKRGAPSLRAAVTKRIQQIEDERRECDGAAPDALAGNKCGPASVKAPSGREAVSLKDMRPASTRTRALLYNGISAHGEGRQAYLRKRKTLTPEKKYEFPLLSSCQYGWKIMEFARPIPSAHARTCVIKDSFYRNSGIILG